ncbi:MAG: hypothetical protein PHH11_18275 [Methylomonas sp.]|nr:hypothetical protein [Methylomonas sp.]
MARHYTTKDFFRQMPSVLLERFFQERDLLKTFDFAGMPDGKPDTLFPLGSNFRKSDVINWTGSFATFSR